MKDSSCRVKKKHELCVVIPVYNEQGAIGDVLSKWDAALRKLCCDYVIRPYNDGSRDGSLEVMKDIAQRLGHRIEVRDKPNGGHGNTILVGYREAVADGFEWVFQVDSDDEMGPEKFSELWNRRADYDFLVGRRDGRKQSLPRKIISFVSRICVRSFFGNGIWDVNAPYRLMRVSAFKNYFEWISLNTFAPNVILSGLAARYCLRCLEIPVPQHDRKTGEVSIKKWKLLKAAITSFVQSIAFALQAPDVKVESSGKWVWMGIAWMCAISVFAWLPDTFFNWGYNYLSFLPVLFTPALFVVCLFVIIGPINRLLPGLFFTPLVKRGWKVFLVVLSPIIFWKFRTQVHCFSGDGCVGTVISDTVLRLSDFIPPIPTHGRLDSWGIVPMSKLLMKFGLLNNFTGMTSHFATQIYHVFWGIVYVLLSVVLFRRSFCAICSLITLPHVFNFFGNLDSYSFSLCVGVVFAYFLSIIHTRKNLSFLHICVATLLWLVGLWTHPFFVFGGFLLISPVAMYINRIQSRVVFKDMFLHVVFTVALFVAISLSQHAKPFFAWEQGGRPPVFSCDTLIHLINVAFFPAAPLAIAVYAENRKECASASFVFLLMTLCFLPLGFTQGANDQFPYMLLSFFLLLPWLLHIVKNGLPRPACRFILSANLFLLIPMIAVHSSDATVARAEFLYPKDPCKHNREMSWQTHLGLLLGDNIIDSQAVKSATLRTFANGARSAQPERFRGGNYLYHTAFLYHFGEFEKGRAQLYGMLRQDPNVVRYFMGVRPAFIYCNRKILWDDIENYFQKYIPSSYRTVKNAIKDCRHKAQTEPYYLKRPKYAKSEY